MKVRSMRRVVGMPDLATAIADPLLPEGGDGTSGATNGGAGAPPTPAAPPAPQVPPVAGAPAAPAVGPHGFPENTKVAEMTDAQAAAYWRHYARENRSELDELREWRKANEAKVGQFDALEAASRTEAERAVAAARDEGAAAARAATEAAVRDRYAPLLVQSRLESATAGRMTPDQVKALMPTLNVAALLDKDGLPDDEKVAAFVAALPVASAPPPPPPPADLGGGRRAPVTTGIDGVAAYERRHGKKSPQT